MNLVLELTRPIRDWGTAESIATVASRYPGCAVRVRATDQCVAVDASNPESVREIFSGQQKASFELVGLGASECAAELVSLNENGLKPGRTTPAGVRWHNILDRIEDFCEANLPSWRW